MVKYTDCSEYYEAEAVALGDTMGERVEAKALARSATTEFESYVKLNKKVPPEVVGVVQQIEDYAKLADTIASHLALKIPDRQAILETTAVTERLEKVLGLMRVKSPCCRSRSASAPASSGRWRRPSASIFSTSR
jgi:ATP-dependent Lon protease, bacterial type